MAEFGATTEKRPVRVDELIGSELMARLDGLDVMSRKIFAGKLQGERRSKKRGVSAEFADYRHYTHGDDLRFVDWNVYARLDRLFLKMFLEEEDLALVLAIDTSASMDFGDPNKLIYCQRLAMALGYVGLVNHNRVTVYAFDDRGVRPLPNLRGRRRTRELGSWLLDLDAGAGADFEGSLKRIALSRQGKGVLVVLSDFMVKEGWENGLRYLAGGGYDTYALQVLSPQETDPASHGLTGDLRLTDVEDGDVAEVTVTGALIEQYKRNLEAWCARLREYCIRRDMMHLVVDTKTPIDGLILETLRRRGLLK